MCGSLCQQCSFYGHYLELMKRIDYLNNGSYTRLKDKIYQFRKITDIMFTLPETNSLPLKTNGWFRWSGFLLGRKGLFSGAMLVSERVLPTWRIIPVSKWLVTMVSKCPKDRVVPLPNGRFMAYKWGLLTTYETWDDPPSNKVPQMENPETHSNGARLAVLEIFTSGGEGRPESIWSFQVGYGAGFQRLGGGFKYFLFSPRSLGRWSNLTSIFFKCVGSTTN